MAATALIFGHSHAWALRRVALAKDYRPPAGIDLRVILHGTKKFPSTLLVQATNGAEHINPALMSALADYPPISRAGDSGDAVWLVSAVQGNYYNIIGILDDGAPFDFIVPGREDLPLNPQANLLPFDAIVEAVKEQAAELEPFYKRLARLDYTGIVHLGTPPPNPSSEMIRELLAAEAALIDKLISVSAPVTRLKLWLVQERVLQDVCESTGVVYLSAPQACKDEAGFLQTKLCKDAIHGTNDYAKLALDDVCAFIAHRHAEKPT